MSATSGLSAGTSSNFSPVKGQSNSLASGRCLKNIGAQHRANRQEWHAHAAGAKAHAHRHVAPFLEALAAFFDMVAHDLGEAPENALREPAGDDFVGHIGAEQEVAVGRNDAARAVRCLRRWRINSQIIAIGVRDMVEPPTPTDIPSCTRVAASCNDMTFSRRLRSRFARFSRNLAYDRTSEPVTPSSSSGSRAGSVDFSFTVELHDEAVPFAR